MACGEAIQKSNQFSDRVAPGCSGAGSLPLTSGGRLRNGLFDPGACAAPKPWARCIFEDTIWSSWMRKLARFDAASLRLALECAIARALCTKRVEIIFEGIDPSQFHPHQYGATRRQPVLHFSGGKVEFRKAHDLVLLAFKEFPAAITTQCWSWSALALAQLSVGFQGRLDVPLGLTLHGTIDVKTWVAKNGIDQGRSSKRAGPNAMMPSILREMDCALAPSRAEPAPICSPRRRWLAACRSFLPPIPGSRPDRGGTRCADAAAGCGAIILMRARRMGRIERGRNRGSAGTATPIQLRKKIGAAGAAGLVEEARPGQITRELKSLLLSL